MTIKTKKSIKKYKHCLYGKTSFKPTTNEINVITLITVFSFFLEFKKHKTILKLIYLNVFTFHFYLFMLHSNCMFHFTHTPYSFRFNNNNFSSSGKTQK